MARMLSATQFSATKTEPGAWVQVRVAPWFKNPVIITALIGGVVGVLQKYAQIELLQTLLPFLPTVWVGFVSDLLLFILIPTLVVIFELGRKSLTTIKS